MATRSSTVSAERSKPKTILHQIHRTSQIATDVFHSELHNIDITPRQFAVLETIMADEGLSQTDLVQRTSIDRSTIADIIRRMQAKGLIRRKRTKADARVYAVTLTEKSRKMMMTAVPAAARADEKLLSALTTTERARLAQYLGKIAATAAEA